MADNKKKFEYNDFSYDPYQESDTVNDAETALNNHLSQKPGEYKSQWQTQLDDTINKILNREKFSYDLNGDALYQQYKDKYIQQGKMAMQDTMGQAAAMTGGYGNSYAQSVGNQAYQASLENLNDIVPELYQMAYDKYNQEGQDLYNQYSVLGAQEAQDYGRYRDSVGDWQSDRGYLAGRYDSERTYDYGKYSDDRNFAYGKYADDKSYAYNEHRNAIADEQWKAEFDEAKRQWQAGFDEGKRQFDEMYGDSVKSYSGTTTGGKNYNNGGLTNGQIKELQAALGVDVDGYYGEKSKSAAGGLSAKEAYAKYVGNQPKPKTDPVSFTGKTYEDAVAYLNKSGVPSGNAAGMMTQNEWSRRKVSYQNSGQGGTEVKNYNSYSEYLKDFVEYAVETYGK